MNKITSSKLIVVLWLIIIFGFNNILDTGGSIYSKSNFIVAGLLENNKGLSKSSKKIEGSGEIVDLLFNTGDDAIKYIEEGSLNAFKLDEGYLI